jgi:hypothetical protein
MLSVWLQTAPVSNLEVLWRKSSALTGSCSLIRTRDLPSWNYTAFSSLLIEILSPAHSVISLNKFLAFSSRSHEVIAMFHQFTMLDNTFGEEAPTTETVWIPTPPAPKPITDVVSPHFPLCAITLLCKCDLMEQSILTLME